MKYNYDSVYKDYSVKNNLIDDKWRKGYANEEHSTKKYVVTVQTISTEEDKRVVRFSGETRTINFLITYNDGSTKTVECSWNIPYNYELQERYFKSPKFYLGKDEDGNDVTRQITLRQEYLVEESPELIDYDPKSTRFYVPSSGGSYSVTWEEYYITKKYGSYYTSDIFSSSTFSSENRNIILANGWNKTAKLDPYTSYTVNNSSKLFNVYLDTDVYDDEITWSLTNSTQISSGEPIIFRYNKTIPSSGATISKMYLVLTHNATVNGQHRDISDTIYALKDWNVSSISQETDKEISINILSLLSTNTYKIYDSEDGRDENFNMIISAKQNGRTEIGYTESITWSIDGYSVSQSGVNVSSTKNENLPSTKGTTSVTAVGKHVITTWYSDGSSATNQIHIDDTTIQYNWSYDSNNSDDEKSINGKFNVTINQYPISTTSTSKSDVTYNFVLTATQSGNNVVGYTFTPTWTAKDDNNITYSVTKNSDTSYALVANSSIPANKESTNVTITLNGQLNAYHSNGNVTTTSDWITSTYTVSWTHGINETSGNRDLPQTATTAQVTNVYDLNTASLTKKDLTFNFTIDGIQAYKKEDEYTDEITWEIKNIVGNTVSDYYYTDFFTIGYDTDGNLQLYMKDDESYLLLSFFQTVTFTLVCKHNASRYTKDEAPDETITLTWYFMDNETDSIKTCSTTKTVQRHSYLSDTPSTISENIKITCRQSYTLLNTTSYTLDYTDFVRTGSYPTYTYTYTGSSIITVQEYEKDSNYYYWEFNAIASAVSITSDEYSYNPTGNTKHYTVGNNSPMLDTTTTLTSTILKKDFTEETISYTGTNATVHLKNWNYSPVPNYESKSYAGVFILNDMIYKPQESKINTTIVFFNNTTNSIKSEYKFEAILIKSDYDNNLLPQSLITGNSKSDFDNYKSNFTGGTQTNCWATTEMFDSANIINQETIKTLTSGGKWSISTDDIEVDGTKYSSLAIGFTAQSLFLTGGSGIITIESSDNLIASYDWKVDITNGGQEYSQYPVIQKIKLSDLIQYLPNLVITFEIDEISSDSQKYQEGIETTYSVAQSDFTDTVDWYVNRYIIETTGSITTNAKQNTGIIDWEDEYEDNITWEIVSVKETNGLKFDYTSYFTFDQDTNTISIANTNTFVLAEEQDIEFVLKCNHEVTEIFDGSEALVTAETCTFTVHLSENASQPYSYNESQVVTINNYSSTLDGEKANETITVQFKQSYVVYTSIDYTLNYDGFYLDKSDAPNDYRYTYTGASILATLDDYGYYTWSYVASATSCSITVYKYSHASQDIGKLKIGEVIVTGDDAFYDSNRTITLSGKIKASAFTEEYKSYAAYETTAKIRQWQDFPEFSTKYPQSTRGAFIIRSIEKAIKNYQVQFVLKNTESQGIEGYYHEGGFQTSCNFNLISISSSATDSLTNQNEIGGDDASVYYEDLKDFTTKNDAEYNTDNEITFSSPIKVCKINDSVTSDVMDLTVDILKYDRFALAIKAPELFELGCSGDIELDNSNNFHNKSIGLWSHYSLYGNLNNTPLIFVWKFKDLQLVDNSVNVITLYINNLTKSNVSDE